jgi:ABC-type bacteriocin/lantibiotic exporter with double-glycine peptidase domain
MKKLIVGSIGLLIIVAVIAFFLFQKPSVPIIEEDLKQVVNKEITNQKTKGNDLSVKEVKAFSEFEGVIRLDCESEINSSVKEEIIRNIGQEILSLYNSKYGEDHDFDITLYVCGGGWTIVREGGSPLDYIPPIY